MTKHIFIGGLVAAGFDPEGKYLLVVSHSGRGVFDTHSWECVARDTELSYPEAVMQVVLVRLALLLSGQRG